MDLQIALLDTNGSALSNITITQLTITYPNSSVLIQNRSMQWNENYFNYTLNAAQTSVLGEYNDKIYFRNANATGFVETCHIITGTGEELQISHSILYIVVLALALSFFVVSLIGAVKIPWKNSRNNLGNVISVNYKKYGKVTFIVASYLLFLLITNLAYSISANYLTFNLAAGVFEWMFRIGLALLLPGIGLAFVVIVINTLSDIRTSSMLKRGLRVR